jgi:ATP-dependent Clp protease ATP-binding subunit ClpX
VAEGDVGRAEWGIVYIDEVDKLSRSPESASGMRDVSGEGVQQALLKLVEGAEVKVSTKGRRREGGEEVTIDTRNILFIAGGAFAGLEERVSNRINPQKGGIGFHMTFPQDDEADLGSILSEVQPDDLRQFGLIPEFIGRFPVIAALQALDEESLVKILTEPRNALVRQYSRLFEFDGIELEFTHDALITIAQLAIERGTGARGLRGVLEKILCHNMFELPSIEDVGHCLVDEDVVKGIKDIIQNPADEMKSHAETKEMATG